MAKTKSLGLAGVGAELIGAAAFVIWPEKIWIAYVLFAVGLSLILLALWQSIKAKLVDDSSQSTGLKILEAVTYFAAREDQKALSDLELEIKAKGIMVLQMASPNLIERRDALWRKMVRDFLNKLRIGELVGTGKLVDTKKRVPIPSAHWDFLKIDYASSSAAGGGYSYSDVRIRQR